MTLVTIEKQEDAAILRLTNGAVNAIGPDLIDELAAAINTIGDEHAGLVLAGNSKFFSLGFDLPHLINADRGAVADFFDQFNTTLLKLYCLPMPTICAAAGHAVAGGFILALACDYRFGGDGKQKMGLNEVQLGVPVPYLADRMLRQIAGDRVASAMVYEGCFITMPQALQWGIVDKILPSDAVETEALNKIKALGALPRRALAAIKANRVETIAAQYQQRHRQKNEAFLDCWFSEPTRALLDAAARRF